MSNASESGAMAMLKTLIKRAAFHATVAIGGFQRRAGGRFPRYASFWRRAAGYVTYAMAGEPFVHDGRAVAVFPPSGAPAVAVPGAASGIHGTPDHHRRWQPRPAPGQPRCEATKASSSDRRHALRTLSTSSPANGTQSSRTRSAFRPEASPSSRTHASAGPWR